MVQLRTGGVLHSQLEYRGPDLLAAAAHEAVRKADPTYRKEDDPDLNKPAVLGGVGAVLGKVPLAGWLLAATGVAVFFLGRPKDGP